MPGIVHSGGRPLDGWCFDPAAPRVIILQPVAMLSTVPAKGAILQDRERETFDVAELAVALSYYDLGVIESITEFTRGSRRSPKVGIVSERGKFLFKRRSFRRAHPDRVRFAHGVQQCLERNSFPMAKLILRRDGRGGFVQIRDQVYELFEFVAGRPYRQTAPETYDAGAVLAHFHRATESCSFPSTAPMPHGDYHDRPGVRTGLCSIGSTLNSHESFSGDEAELAGLIQFLLEAYDDAAEAVNQLGFQSWPERIIHSDWHPGNLLFRKQKVAAVIDYDSVRRSRRIIDTANGALQFSMIAGGDPASWPDHLDEERWNAFLNGYESLSPLLAEECRCIPHLMTEALIAECVPPITETGSVGQWAGFRVLLMVRRKLKWLSSHRDRLMRIVRR
jgi:Ser/Thr protein kinase RdoA (MazF antagonist)